MIAVKIFNNNSILSKNDKGEEIILVGGGIGFGIRKNDVIDERKIEKVFCLEKETNYKFQSIALRICCDFGYRSYRNPLEPCPKLRIMQIFLSPVLV